jgi:hypothetical protein
VFATHTLPAKSTAIPAGEDKSVGSIIPPEGEIAAPAFENKLTALFPSVTHTCPLPSIATAAGVFNPPPELIECCGIPVWPVASSSGPAPTLHTFPALSIATATFAPASALDVIPNPFPASSLVPPPPSTIHTLSPLTTSGFVALVVAYVFTLGINVAVIV